MTHVTLFDTQSALKIEPDQVVRFVQAFLLWKKISCEEVIFHLVDKSEICSLHDEFFSDPTPTDCITFPIDSPHSPDCLVLGEVFICPEVAIEQATEFDCEPYRECSLYIVHGLLHLLGFDDIEEGDREEMRQQERLALEYLEDQNLILHYS